MPAPIAAADLPPPVNNEAERSVIGAILVDSDVVWRVYGWLRPSHFYDTFHQAVYSTIMRLADEHVAIDIITVRDAMMAAEPTGTSVTARVASLVDGVPDIAGIEHWARIVKRDADRRSGMALCEQLTERFASSLDVRGAASTMLDHATDMLDGDDGRIATVGVASLAKAALHELDERMAGAEIPIGIPSGYRGIDAMTHGFPRGAVTIVGAPRKVGKTTFLLGCALNAASAGYNVLYYSIDMPSRFVRDRILSMVSGVDTEFVKTGVVTQRGLYGGMSRDELLQRVIDGNQRLQQLPGILDINDTSDDLAEIVAEVSVRARMGKVDIVFVDYIQQVQTASLRVENEHRRITAVGGKMRTLARKSDIAVVLAAQPNRTLHPTERMSLRHLAESSSLEQIPRVAIMLFRPGAETGSDKLACDMTAIIDKNEGRVGDVPLHAEMWCYRITERQHGDDCAFTGGNGR